NAAGSFQLQNAVSDAQSGPAQSTFPALGGTTTGWSHTAPAAVTTPTGGPYSSGASPNNFSWTNPTSSSPTEAIVSTDNAGNPATTPATTTDDTTNATGAVTSPATGTHYNAAGWTGSISGTAADSGSGVGTVKVSIQKDGGANACWDGTNAAGHFTAACP